MVIKALGNPSIVAEPSFVEQLVAPKVELQVVCDKLRGRYFVAGTYMLDETVTLHKLKPITHFFSSGQGMFGGWHPTGEVIEVKL